MSATTHLNVTSTSLPPSSRPVNRAVQLGFAVAVTSALLMPLCPSPWSGAPPSQGRRSPSVSFADYTSSTYAGAEWSSNAPSDDGRTANSVADLRALSGLTADQIGRLFGVSRRSVQNWVAGTPMAATHEERLSRLTMVVAATGSSPEERRRKLLSSASGVSLFHQLVSELGEDAVLQPVAIPARDLLNA